MNKKKKPKHSHKAVIVDALYAAAEKYRKAFPNSDESYFSYLTFCISGAFLLQDIGPERFNEIVQEILAREKPTRGDK
jgi:hypothetical protein